MFELALGYGTRAVQLQDIAKKQNLSEKYLGKLVFQLKKANLIDSIRGAHGGYTLKDEPENITVLDIVTVLEGNLSIVDCTSEVVDCNQSRACPSRNIWCGLSKVINDYLSGITLQDLVEKYSSDAEMGEDMYFI
jgi:Rrf2 family protein